ncbi:o-demethylpuromycin o-methyltransferase [Leptolyngbya sp. Heron Island J]|uniref:methyltransferase n=1 Tax=Leptolyngbya sp. Heron Island J TaxID=1385935 RepID=UPI0003B9D941|nr:methyltransferase [Leptolyngbya sp. Heron Island J]ESA38720.1 o-demethylpuromycin o-methyltransferase [Leptolyngbya sp. Heron Island J]
MSEPEIFEQKAPRQSSHINSMQDLLATLTGFWVSQSVYAAVELGIADLLKDGPKHVSEISAVTEADSGALYRLMRSLASVGLFTETKRECFEITSVGTCLQADHPNSLRTTALLLGREQFNPWADIVYSIRTGKCAYKYRKGMSFFKHLEQDDNAATTFNEAMTDYIRNVGFFVAESYDFSRYSTIVDVGSGHGILSSSILDRNPKLKSILFDTPNVIESAKEYTSGDKTVGRLEFISGDFFESVPQGGDIYILSNIVHNWNDERSTKILRNCYDAMVENGRLLLVEVVLQAEEQPLFCDFLDLHMLVMLGGKERTEDEYKNLISSSGFVLKSIIETNFYPSIIECVRV